ncbi:MAG: DUF6443 domain-containing protein [Hymenobacter sp.]
MGSYRTRVTNDWVVGVTLYSRPHYLDIPLPAAGAQPARRHEPSGGGSRPRPPPPDAQAPAVAPEMNYVRVWTPRQALTQPAAGPTRPAGVRREQWAGVTGRGGSHPSGYPAPGRAAAAEPGGHHHQRLPVRGPAAGLAHSPAEREPTSSTSAPATPGSSGSAPTRTRPTPSSWPAARAGPAVRATTPAPPAPRYRSRPASPTTWKCATSTTTAPATCRRAGSCPTAASSASPSPGNTCGPTRPAPPAPATPPGPWSRPVMSTQYLDGLGRPVQTVQWQASPSKHDVVQPQAYDGLGRAPRQFLPYVADSTSGGYRPRALLEQGRYYAALPPTGPPSPQDLTQGVARTGVAYAETQFEASPLNRVAAQAAPGETWQLTGGHPVERVERPNVFADSLLRFAPGYNPQDPDPHCQGSYAPGELWGVLTKDEHGYWAAEWKDKLGQVVGKAVQTQAPGQGRGPPGAGCARLTPTTTSGICASCCRPRPAGGSWRRVRSLAPAPPPAGVRWEQWADVAGTQVTDIPVSQPPSQVQTLPQAGAGQRGLPLREPAAGLAAAAPERGLLLLPDGQRRGRALAQYRCRPHA